MNDTKQRADALRAELQRLTAMAPAWIGSASVQQVDAWRDVHASATKLLQSGRINVQALRSAVSAMQAANKTEGS